MDITEIKKYEIGEIYDFLEGLREYGHVYHYPPENLDKPFQKILEGILEVQKMMENSFEI